MTYRAKVIVLLVVMALVTTSVSVGLMYVKFRHLLFDEIRSKVLSIATTTAALLPGDLHKDLRTRADEEGSSYRTLETLLRRARDANRRSDVYVAYLCSFRRAPEDPSLIEFGVDAEENLENKSHIGDIYKYKGDKKGLIKIEEPDVEPFMEDQWGKWLSATAPIRDSSGQVVAAVNVDVDAKSVTKELNKVLIIGFAVLGLAVVLALFIALFLSKRVSAPLYTLKNAVEAIGKGDLAARVDLKTRDEFGAVAQAINAMAVGLRERETLKSAFARYVSHQVMENILSSGEMPTVQGDRRRITVLFADIRDFTPLAESMRPEKVVGLLNEYFEKMIDVIFRNKGTLDKFIGDGLMVIFGAPLEDLDQEEHAVRTALEMQEEVRKLCQRWKTEGRASLRVGIGVNSGNAIVGNIGSTQRMEYTAIGDTVNLAARLEAATKEISADILISEYTAGVVRSAFKLNKVGPLQLKGKSDTVTAYSVEGFQS